MVALLKSSPLSLSVCVSLSPVLWSYAGTTARKSKIPWLDQSMVYERPICALLSSVVCLFLATSPKAVEYSFILHQSAHNRLRQREGESGEKKTHKLFDLSSSLYVLAPLAGSQRSTQSYEHHLRLAPGQSSNAVVVAVVVVELCERVLMFI